MNESLSTWECNHWCPAFLDLHHPSAVSKETETAEPLTVCEFQRPSSSRGFDATLAEASSSPHKDLLTRKILVCYLI